MILKYYWIIDQCSYGVIMRSGDVTCLWIHGRYVVFRGKIQNTFHMIILLYFGSVGTLWKVISVWGVPPPGPSATR